MMGQVLLERGQLLEGVRAPRQALEILVGMGARADAERVVEILEDVRRELGEEVFGVLWALAGADLSQPSWTSGRAAAFAAAGTGARVRMISVEEWVRESARAAREGSTEREEWRALAEGVAGAENAPEELRALARVLLQVLDGNPELDLSGLPEEWAAWVREAVGG